VIDSYGRVVARLGLDRAGALDSELPLPSASRTLFSRYGNSIPGVMVLLMFLAAVVLQKRQSTTTE